MPPISRRLLVLALPLALLTATARQAHACSIPVFRYALERWMPEPYELLIFHKGKLAVADQTVVDWLRKTAAAEGTRPNVELHLVDLAKPLDKGPQAVWKGVETGQWTEDSKRSAEGGRQTKAKEVASPGPQSAIVPPVELPWGVLRYPQFLDIPQPAWTGRLSPQAAKALVDSPARRDLVKRLLGGASAVWVLLESGDRKSDDATAKLLGDELKKMEKELVLPEQDATDYYGDAPPAAEGDEAPAPPKLTISFPLVRLSRKAPGEQVFISMLLAAEPDLATCGKPITVPVFGQGRALFALVGDGIVADNIDDACAFLTGPCACQVKAMNPGIDLLVLADWEGGLMGEPIKEDPLLPLPGTLAPDVKPVDNGQWTVDSEGKAKAKAAKVEPEAAQPGAAVSKGSDALWRNMLIAVAGGVALLAVAAFVILRKPGS